MIRSTMKIVRYDISLIETLLTNIITKLDTETIKKLTEIKVNNKFITQSNPVVLKYLMEGDTANVWRNEKLNKTQDDLTLFNETLNSNLNKLTNLNFDDIQKKIVELINKLDTIDNTYRSSILDIIFNKSITQHTYACLYSKLLITLIQLLGENFKNGLKNVQEKLAKRDDGLGKCLIKQKNLFINALTCPTTSRIETLFSYRIMRFLWGLFQQAPEYDLALK